MDKYYGVARAELSVAQWWEKKAQDKPIQQDKSRPVFTIIMPPPNVTGSLHLGHALSSTFQDILVRFYRMKGYDVKWIAGTDHAGIATQMMVEKQIEQEGTTRQSMGREAFLQRVWQWKDQYGSIILDQMKRMGFSAHWEKVHFTLDADMSVAVQEAFVRLYDKGLVYRAEKLVNWDCQLKTAVSDLEVINKMESGYFWTLSYAVAGQGNEKIQVATTRPETLFGDVAIAFHPEDPRYKQMIGKHAIIPLTDRRIPLIADASIEMGKGTGAVKITPAHDFFDCEIAHRHGLPFISILDESGCLVGAQVPASLQHVDRFDARKSVLAALKEEGALISEEEITHSVPYSDRSGTIIEPRLTKQWFIDMTAMADAALKAVDTGQSLFVSSIWKAHYQEWLTHIQPWCVSRQLWWGHPIPAWHAEDGQVFVARSQKEAEEQARIHFGKDVVLSPDGDVLDTWFSSGLWPFSTLGWPLTDSELTQRYPTSVLVTGFDIIFFWVARMMMLGIEMTGKAPFRDIYIHPLIRDEKGQKMSKTKKNVINPLDIIKDYGADGLRFALASASAGSQYMKFSLRNVEHAQHFMTKLWNVTRFLNMNGVLTDMHKEHYVQRPAQCLIPMHQWLMAEFDQVLACVEKHLKAYAFQDAALVVHHFIWHVLCDWAVEFAKYGFSQASMRQETEHVLSWIFAQSLALLHPFMPFITEYIWSFLGQEKGSLQCSPWPLPWGESNLDTHEACHFMMTAISTIRRLRHDFSLTTQTKLSLSIVGPSLKCYEVLEYYRTFLCQWLQLDQLHIGNSDPLWRHQEDWITFPLESGGSLRVDLKGKIDGKAERLRLEKTIEKIKIEMEQITQRLAHDDFIARAPEEIITELQERKESAVASLLQHEKTLTLLQDYV